MKNSNSTHLTISLVVTALSMLSGYLLFSDLLKKDEAKLEARLEELFDGKDAVTDGEKITKTGELSKNRRNYTLLSGGFVVYELTKESNGFVKSEFTARDLRFKEDEYEYIYGYKYDNYRPSVQTCYDRAFEYLVKGNEDDVKYSYSPNKLVDIKNFPQGYSTNFYSIESAYHPKELYEFQNATGMVYTDVYEVDYSLHNRYFSIIKNKENINISLIIYLVSSLSVGLLLSVLAKPLAKFLQPNPKRFDLVFGKRWKSVNRNFIMYFETGMLGKNKATIIEEGIINKGTMKFTDDGKSMNISLVNTEYYYQIDRLTDSIIELVDILDGKTEQFEVLGSSVSTKQQHDKEEITENQKQENDQDSN